MHTPNRGQAVGALMALGVDYNQAEDLVAQALTHMGRTFGSNAAMVAYNLEPPAGFTVAGDGTPAVRPVYRDVQIVRTGSTGIADNHGDYATVKALSGASSWNTTLSLAELVALGGTINRFVTAHGS